MTRVCSCDLQKKLLENSLGFNYKFLDELKLHYAMTLLLSKSPTLPGRGLLFLQILGQAPSLGSFEVPSAGGATWWLLLQLLGLPSDYLIDHPQSLFNLTAKWGWVLFCKSHTLPGNYLRLLQILGQALNRTAP